MINIFCNYVSMEWLKKDEKRGLCYIYLFVGFLFVDLFQIYIFMVGKGDLSAVRMWLSVGAGVIYILINHLIVRFWIPNKILFIFDGLLMSVLILRYAIMSLQERLILF